MKNKKQVKIPAAALSLARLGEKQLKVQRKLLRLIKRGAVQRLKKKALIIKRLQKRHK